MKKRPANRLTLCAIAVAGIFSVNAHAVQVSCSNANGCSAKSQSHITTVNGVTQSTTTTWTVDNQNISDTDLTLLIPAGNYSNIKSQSTGYVVGNPAATTEYDRLFYLSNPSPTASTGKLLIQSGVNASLDEAKENSSLVSVHGEATAEIQKGVTLTINNSYAQKNRLPHQYNDETHYNAGELIDVYTNSTEKQGANVSTSADLIVNGEGAVGIHAQGLLTKLTASDHKIELNGAYTDAVTAADGAKVDMDKVSITGNGSVAIALVSLSESNESLANNERAIINFNNGSIKLDNNVSGVIYGNSAVVNLNNSTAEAAYGIFHISDDSDAFNTDEITLNNSTLSGRTALLAVDKPIENLLEAGSNILLRDINITANNSKLNGISYINSNRLANAGKVNMTLNNNSVWTYNGNSEVDNLNVNDSALVSQQSSDGIFNTLTINGNLTGNGNFTLNTDLANQKGDIVI